jgi:hypothetical protein
MPKEKTESEKLHGELVDLSGEANPGRAGINFEAIQRGMS